MEQACIFTEADLAQVPSTAVVTHFSDYILLDKSLKDLFYESLGIPAPEDLAAERETGAEWAACR